MLVNSRLFQGIQTVPSRIAATIPQMTEAPSQTNTCLLTQQTSNRPNSWVEAMCEEELRDGGVVCSV